MIEFHRPEQPDRFSDKIEKRLEEMVLAHKVIRNNEQDQDDTDLPCLKENDRTIRGEENIRRTVREIEQELREQRMVSGDACYIDPRTGDLC